MSIVAVTWETAHLHGETWISHHRLRYRLFVERQGWEIPTYNNMEYDQFDTPAAVYLIWHDDQQQARAVTRLVSTERPYMIQELWPELAGHEPLPSAPDVWEASRFGVDRDLDPKVRNRALGELIVGCLEYGLLHDIKYYLCVMPVWILKGILMRSGVALDFLDKPVHMDGHDIAAARITITPKVLAEARRRRKIFKPVLLTDERIAA